MWRLAKTFAVCQRTIEKSISRFVHKVNAEMSGKPDLYIDRRSPPVRSVLLLLEALKIEVNEKPIDLFKGEHLADDYLKVSFISLLASTLTFYSNWLISDFPLKGDAIAYSAIV